MPESKNALGTPAKAARNESEPGVMKAPLNEGASNPPVLTVYGPNPAVTAAAAQAANQREHQMMAVRAVSNLVTLNSTPG